MRNIYKITDPEEMAVAVVEYREKARILHEERLRAHQEMRDAMAQHEFLVTACRVAETEEDNARARLKELVGRRAWEIVREMEVC